MMERRSVDAILYMELELSSIELRLRRVFRDVFENDEMEIFEAMNAKDVPEWDSLAQVKLVIGVEEEFGVKFTTRDVTGLACVGDLKRLLFSKGVA